MLFKTAVRMGFSLMSRERASAMIRTQRDKYLALAEKFTTDSGSRIVTVPKMAGVDDDMRHWSFFMLLEHNVIVNNAITSIVASLARGEEPTGAGAINPKTEVLPSRDAGVEQVDAFRESVPKHLQVVSAVPSLRTSSIKRHPVFGNFNAHQWHCMFAFHLLIHYRQARLITRKGVGI